MKKVFLFISLCFALLSSCSDFLKEEDKDKVIPRTVDHFLQIMHREAFITNKIFDGVYDGRYRGEGENFI